MSINILNLIGLGSGFIGSVILAFSMSGIVSMLSLLVNSIELDTASNGELKATGLDKHMVKSKKGCSVWTIIGLIFLALGFALQFFALLSCK